MHRIIADENMPGLEAFKPFGSVTLLPGREICHADLTDCDVLLVRSVTQVNQQLLANTPVRFVGSATIGTDHVDLDWLATAGIRFAHAPGCNAQAVVEYVLQAILSWCVKHQRSPVGMSLGVVGVGNVGSRLAAHAEALGMAVQVSDPPRQQQEGDIGWPAVALTDILACDIVSLHVPLVKAGANATEHLLGAKQLASMTSSQLLINSCRGSVIDNQALLTQLQQGGPDCVLDVWEAEPQVPADLFNQVWRGTPHIAGYSLEGKQRGSWALLTALAQWLGQQVTPPTLSPAGELALDINDWQDVLAWLRHAYHIEEDHQRLEQSLTLVDPAQAFDRLRKNYPLRRELSAWQLQGNQSISFDALISLLKAC